MGFNRRIGEFAESFITPEGEIVDEATWTAKEFDYLPNEADLLFLKELMQPEYRQGEYATWIAAPKVGINSKPGDFEYVKIYGSSN
jgi:benzoyl-CoA 2,3-dioxygenase component B